MYVLVTGGCGFIGSNFVRHLRREHPEDRIVVLDALTYAGNFANLDGIGAYEQTHFLNAYAARSGIECSRRREETGVPFVRVDVCDRRLVDLVFANNHQVDAVVHFAASSHVDRSIQDATEFIRTNVLGTQVLLDAARAAGVKKFVMISTDEVMGDLGPDDPSFTEASSIRPRSPYAASKAAGEMLALAAYHTHDHDVVVVRPSNNYGPYQFPEKLIPLAILRAFAGEAIPVYGEGAQERDWLHVEDCCTAIDLVLRRGRAGEVYCVGTGTSASNLTVVRRIIDFVGKGTIQHVADRPGHDFRYAVDASKIRSELGWTPRMPSVVDGLRATVQWYRENEAWWRPILRGEHAAWIEQNYGKR